MSGRVGGAGSVAGSQVTTHRSIYENALRLLASFLGSSVQGMVLIKWLVAQRGIFCFKRARVLERLLTPVRNVDCKPALPVATISLSSLPLIVSADASVLTGKREGAPRLSCRLEHLSVPQHCNRSRLERSLIERNSRSQQLRSPKRHLPKGRS